MTRSFLQIMRDALIAHQAGVSVPVALMATCNNADWDVIWRALMQAARLEKALKKFRTGQHG